MAVARRVWYPNFHALPISQYNMLWYVRLHIKVINNIQEFPILWVQSQEHQYYLSSFLIIGVLDKHMIILKKLNLHQQGSQSGSINIILYLTGLLSSIKVKVWDTSWRSHINETFYRTNDPVLHVPKKKPQTSSKSPWRTRDLDEPKPMLWNLNLPYKLFFYQVNIIRF